MASVWLLAMKLQLRRTLTYFTEIQTLTLNTTDADNLSHTTSNSFIYSNICYTAMHFFLKASQRFFHSKSLILQCSQLSICVTLNTT